MHTIETRYPDGTRARYTLAPGSTVPLQLAALKPLRKPRSKPCKRAYPRWTADMSTKDYIGAYWRINGLCGKPAQLFAPLPDRPAPFYMGVDTVETIEGDAA
jgi:hypothetical protein